ncbi:hypothetical protein U1Q18_024350 [Sarracenia purpurea var. burkii]
MDCQHIKWAHSFFVFFVANRAQFRREFVKLLQCANWNRNGNLLLGLGFQVMKATREMEDLLDRIRPPRLEDVGLEDCASTRIDQGGYPKSDHHRRITSRLNFHASEEEGRCTNDPWPNSGKSSDALVGINDGINPPSRRLHHRERRRRV